MLKFLKKLFLGTENKPQVIESIELNDLSKFFESKVSEHDNEIKKDLAVIRQDLRSVISSAKESLDVLENASLQNPKVSVREIQFMQGNRSTYLRMTRHFLDQVLDIIDYDVGFFLTNYHEFLSSYAKSSFRSFRILQEFFSSESASVATQIKQIDMQVDRLKTEEKFHSHAKIEHIRKELVSLENRKNKKNEMIEELKKINVDIVTSRNNHIALEKNKQDIESSKDYFSLEQAKLKKEGIINELNFLKEELNRDFSHLERPLKKYQRVSISHENLIERYIADPESALVSDTSFKILEVLTGLSKYIQKDSTVLKDAKETRKVLDSISRLTKEYLLSHAQKHNSLIAEKHSCTKEIDSSPLLENLDLLKEQIDSVASQLSHLENRKKTLEHDLSDEYVLSLQKKLVADIESLLGIKINLIDGDNKSEKIEDSLDLQK